MQSAVAEVAVKTDIEGMATCEKKAVSPVIKNAPGIPTDENGYDKYVKKLHLAETDTKAAASEAAMSGHESSSISGPSKISDTSSPVHWTSARTGIIERVAGSKAFFKSQQRGEPEPSLDEKREIANSLLDKKPAIFLERYGIFLKEEDLDYFKPMASDYSIDYHIKHLSKCLKEQYKKTLVKNRRYEAMKRLEEAGEYFSEEEMKSRDPLLYDQMIGQFLSDDEVQDRVECNQQSLSGMLFYHIQALHNSQLYDELREKEESQMEEGDSEDDGEDSESEMEETDEGKNTGEQQTSSAEKQLLRQEFTNIMKERFLNGEDREFDYRSVDDNQQFDACDVIDRDAEEAYFNEDEADDLEQPVGGGDRYLAAAAVLAGSDREKY